MTTTEPVNGHRARAAEGMPRQALPAGDAGTPEPASTSNFESVQRLAKQQAEARELREIQSDDVFGDVLSEEEMKEDKRVAETIRTAARSSRLNIGLRRVKDDDKQAKDQAKLARIAMKEKVWQARALRQRNKVIDPAAKLARTYRLYLFVAAVLAAGTVGGIIWTSTGVADALSASASPAWYLYLVEPLFCVPLLLIVVMQIVAALNGRLEDMLTRKVTGIEVGILVVTIVLNVSAVFTGGSWNVTELFSRTGAPVLIVITVVLQLVAAELFGDILRDARLSSLAETDPKSVRDLVVRAKERAEQVREAMAHRSIPVQEDGYPSVTAIQKAFGGEKVVAQSARDLLVQADSSKETRP